MHFNKKASLIVNVVTFLFLGSCSSPGASRSLTGSGDAGVPSDAAIDEAEPIAENGDAAEGAAPSVDGAMAGPDAGVQCGPDPQYKTSICRGTADPTTLGSGILPVASMVANGKPGLDFYCRPANPSDYNGMVLLHFVGTFDDPALDNALPRFACSLGYAAIAPMWENSIEVETVCDSLTDKAAQSACFGETRRAVLYGDTPQIPPVSVSKSDCIVSRTATLLAGLISMDPGFSAWSTLSNDFNADDLGKFTLSGHSQGSGYALMLGGDIAARRVLMLSGPDDRVDSGQAYNSACGWLAAFSSLPPKTPPAQYYAYVNDGDTVGSPPQYEANYDLIGVGATSCPFIGAQAPAYSADCRRLVYPAGCTDGTNAHGSTTVASFGAPPSCVLGGVANDNEFTWRFMLTNP